MPANGRARLLSKETTSSKQHALTQCRSAAAEWKSPGAARGPAPRSTGCLPFHEATRGRRSLLRLSPTPEPGGLLAVFQRSQRTGGDEHLVNELAELLATLADIPTDLPLGTPPRLARPTAAPRSTSAVCRCLRGASRSAINDESIRPATHPAAAPAAAQAACVPAEPTTPTPGARSVDALHTSEPTHALTCPRTRGPCGSARTAPLSIASFPPTPFDPRQSSRVASRSDGSEAKSSVPTGAKSDVRAHLGHPTIASAELLRSSTSPTRSFRGTWLVILNDLIAVGFRVGLGH